MAGWRYATAKEERARAKKRKSMSREDYAAYENEEQRKFNANPANRHKAGSKAAQQSTAKKRIVGGSGGGGRRR